MKTENQTLSQVPLEQSQAAVDPASPYRTKWLTANNRLHAFVHEPSVPLAEAWNAYLSELQSAENAARQAA
jgi:hypothetical protein